MAEFLTEMGNEYKIAVNRPYNFSAIWNLGTAMIKNTIAAILLYILSPKLRPLA